MQAPDHMGGEISLDTRRIMRMKWIKDEITRVSVNLFDNWEHIKIQKGDEIPVSMKNPIVRKELEIVLCVECKMENRGDFRFCYFCGEKSLRFKQQHKLGTTKIQCTSRRT